jgi:hypothetical protein
MICRPVFKSDDAIMLCVSLSGRFTHEFALIPTIDKRPCRWRRILGTRMLFIMLSAFRKEGDMKPHVNVTVFFVALFSIGSIEVAFGQSPGMAPNQGSASIPGSTFGSASGSSSVDSFRSTILPPVTGAGPTPGIGESSGPDQSFGMPPSNTGERFRDMGAGSGSDLYMGARPRSDMGAGSSMSSGLGPGTGASSTPGSSSGTTGKSGPGSGAGVGIGSSPGPAGSFTR